MHPIQRQIADLRSSLRLSLAVYGLSRCLAVCLAIVIVLGTADYLLRFQDPGIRLISSGLAWAVIAAAGYRYVVRPLRLELGDVDLAYRVQRAFPALGDRLWSAVEFLGQREDEPGAGSAALRRAVVADAAAASQNVAFGSVLDHGPMIRAIGLLLAASLLATALVASNPGASVTALARLVKPLGGTQWPQHTHLAYRHVVQRVARGQAFEIEVVDAQGAALPNEVRIQYRFDAPQGPAAVETEAMRALRNAFTARRENVTRPFSYRVEGGDDLRQPWIALDVIDPPAVESLAVRLIPPDYSGWPPTQSDRQIRALSGTRLEFSGRGSRPLAAAQLVLDDGRTWRLALDTPQDFQGPAPSQPLVADKSQSYWFALTDEQGLTGGDADRWEIRVLADAPPTVVIEQPAADPYVTPTAALPLRITAKDDLAVRSVGLAFRRGDTGGGAGGGGPESRQPIYAGPERAGASAIGGAGELRAIAYRWDLAPLGLRPGETLAFTAEASDYRPQTARSAARRVRVITPEELLERMAAQQTIILSELSRILTIQTDARGQVASIERRAGEPAPWEQADADRLQAAALLQRQVDRLLGRQGDGVPVHAQALLDDLANNRVDSPDVARRMESLLARIGHIEKQLLASLARHLTAAVKAAQNRVARPEAPVDPLLINSLAAAGADQDQVIAALKAILGELHQLDDYRRFHRELGELVRQQESLGQQTSDLARITLARDLRDLVPQQAAELRLRGRQQLDLALRLDQLLEQMQQASARLSESDPLAAETIADAADEAQRLGVAGQMRTVRAQIDENQMGQAVPGQQQVLQSLRDVLDILSGRKEHELARLVKKLDDAQGELDGLVRRQEELSRQWAEAASKPQESAQLAAKQRPIEEETRRLARRLERLLAQRAAQSTSSAAERMGQAGQSARQGDANAAKNQAADAKRLLDEARQQLAQRRFQAKAELLHEQLARLEDSVRHLHAVEKKLLEETRRLESLRAASGQLTPGQESSRTELARQQRGLHADTLRLAGPLGSGSSFKLALVGAAGHMDRAVMLLDRGETGQPTQQAQQQAVARLDLLGKALEQDPDDDSAPGGAGPGGDQQGQAPGGLLAAAELKLLKLMQEDIRQRTEALAKAEPKDEQVKRQIQQLAEEQGSLAELTLRMLLPEPKQGGAR